MPKAAPDYWRDWYIRTYSFDVHAQRLEKMARQPANLWAEWCGWQFIAGRLDKDFDAVYGAPGYFPDGWRWFDVLICPVCNYFPGAL